MKGKILGIIESTGQVIRAGASVEGKDKSPFWTCHIIDMQTHDRAMLMDWTQWFHNYLQKCRRIQGCYPAEILKESMEILINTFLKERNTK